MYAFLCGFGSADDLMVCETAVLVGVYKRKTHIGIGLCERWGWGSMGYTVSVNVYDSNVLGWAEHTHSSHVNSQRDNEFCG